MKNRFLIMIFLGSALSFMDGTTPLFANESEIQNENFETLIIKHVSFDGKIELEAEWSEDFNNEHNNSISVASLEFDIQVDLAEWGAGKLIVDRDDEKEKIIVDETYLTIGNTEKFPLFIQAGRYNLPFGVYEGNTISDPLTKEAFETKEDAVNLGLEYRGFDANFYVFDGETNIDHRNQFGGGIRYGINNDFIRFAGGMDIINSILDGNVFSDSLKLDNQPGLAAHAQIGMGGLGIFAEYTTALDTVEGVKPRAWQIEGSYVIDVMEKATFFSLGYSQTDNFAGLLPKRRIAAVAGIEFFDGMLLTIEYAHDKDYGASDDSLGDTLPNGGEESLITIQLAYEF